MLSIRIINHSDPAYPAVIDLRQRILRAPLGLDIRDEDLSGETEEVILIAEDNGVLAGCLLLQHKDPTTFKLRQMAVDTAWQRKSIGAQLVAEAERYARSVGKTRIVLHARMTAMSFYRKSGYDVCSDSFTEVGIPHVLMKKNLL
jgi:predicted GNAT family N-acyltransferase